MSMKNCKIGVSQSTYVTTSSGIRYCLQLYSNGIQKENHGKVFVFLKLKIGYLKEVDTKCMITVESANNYSREIEHIYKESNSWGKRYCNTAELFDPRNGFIHDEKLELKVDGSFVFDDGKVNNRLYLPSKFGDELWAYEETKDFKILVGGKVI